MNNYNTSNNLSEVLLHAGCTLQTNAWFSTEETNRRRCYQYEILNHICCEYAREFFGEDDYHIEWVTDDEDCDHPITEKAYIYHPKRILELLQDGLKKDAEQYIWENTVFYKHYLYFDKEII